LGGEVQKNVHKAGDKCVKNIKPSVSDAENFQEMVCIYSPNIFC